MFEKIKTILGYARVAQLPYLARRALRIPATSRADFSTPLSEAEIARMRAISRAVRGEAARPIVFIHGVLPRSGTNYLADILALHPDVHAHPGRIWEFPLLYVAPGARALQREFVGMFTRNAEVTTEYDFLAFIASGWAKMLQQEAPDRTLVIKTPHVQHIDLFRYIFPNDKLILCLRDGRDVLQSSMDTFKDSPLTRKSFAELCREWAFGAEVILDHEPGGHFQSPNVMVARYEPIAAGDQDMVQKLVAHGGLDPRRFPFDAYRALPVRGSSRSQRKDHDRWSTPEPRTADFNPVGRWETWSKREKAVFKKIAGPALVRAGYARNGNW